MPCLHYKVERISTPVMVHLQAAGVLAAQKASKKQAMAMHRLGLLGRAVQAWCDWQGKCLAKMAAEHEQVIYAQVHTGL